MKVILKLSLILVLAFGARVVEAQDVQKAMVQFDQAFIPVWFYTHEGEILKAKASIFPLEFQWQQFRMKYAKAVEAEEWQFTFDRIDDWLADAYYAIDRNQLEVAFNQLEFVKYELRQLRRLYGIDYYLDELYDFQDALAVLMEATVDPAMSLMDWNEFEDLADAVHLQWRGIMSHYFDAELHGFSDAERALYQAKQEKLERALARFTDLVKYADQEALAAAGTELEPAYYELLRLFGRSSVPPPYLALSPKP